jgi:DNA-binding transcriptional ArsR family regulator
MDTGVAGAVATTLKALAEPLRLRMLSFIATAPAGEACVCDLSALSDVSQPTVSHHLKVLRGVGVLTAERRGPWLQGRGFRAPRVLRPRRPGIHARDTSHDGAHGRRRLA